MPPWGRLVRTSWVDWNVDVVDPTRRDPRRQSAADAVRPGLAVQPAPLRAGGGGRLAPSACARRRSPTSTSPPSAARAAPASPGSSSGCEHPVAVASEPERLRAGRRRRHPSGRPARARAAAPAHAAVGRAHPPRPGVAATCASAVEPGHSWWHGGDLGDASDQARDRACDEIGWRIIRLRRGGARGPARHRPAARGASTPSGSARCEAPDRGFRVQKPARNDTRLVVVRTAQAGGPNWRSPASPRPGTMKAWSLRWSSTAAVTTCSERPASRRRSMPSGRARARTRR